jgi:hypothetical protein
MAVDERARHRLYLRLEEVLGSEEATVLMAHLPPTGWGDVATQRDIEGLRVATQREIEGLRAATQQDIAGLRVEVQAVRHDMGELEKRMDLRFQTLEHKLTAHFESALRQQARTFMIFMASFGFSLAAAVIGAAKLL